eukprot:XP_016662560.1 PREDICTED: uncharacterized protein LOC107884599 [Acyrthosiphon pisum]
MVFFKQYLITLTCIVISVWVTSVNSTKYADIKGARYDCQVCSFCCRINATLYQKILRCAGFEDDASADISIVQYEELLKSNSGYELVELTSCHPLMGIPIIGYYNHCRGRPIIHFPFNFEYARFLNNEDESKPTLV